MARFVVFNTINSDGVGDFSHFEDIMKKLLNHPKFIGVEWIAIVEFRPDGSTLNYERIREKLGALNIEFYFGTPDEHIAFLANKYLHEKLKSADQAIVISYNHGLFESYNQYLTFNIPVKCIGEHEQAMSIHCQHPDGRHPFGMYEHELMRSLGLSRKKYGIKIDDIFRVSHEEAWSTLMTYDRDFAEKLLFFTQTRHFDELHRTHVIVPAYFNNNWEFFEFLRLFSIPNAYHEDKDILVYHSGSHLGTFLKSIDYSPYDEIPTGFDLPAEKLKQIATLFASELIKKIEVYSPDELEPIIIPCCPSGRKSIRIFSGFYLKSPSFDAIYHLSNIAGVSGDNTFERCVSMNVLPFYCSTNAHIKVDTLIALRDISKRPNLFISNRARQSFQIFFSPDFTVHGQWATGFPFHNRLRSDRYQNINLQAMIDAWPRVTAYLREHNNFYDHLEDIILEKLSPEIQSECGIAPAAFDIASESPESSHMSPRFFASANNPKSTVKKSSKTRLGASFKKI